MRSRHFLLLLLLNIVITFQVECFSADLEFGKWHVYKVKDEYSFPALKDSDEIAKAGLIFPASAPWPCREGSKSCWSIPGPLPPGPEYKLYSFIVYEYGYTLIERTRRPEGFDDIEWGWKLTIENKSKHDVWAYAYCALLDKDEFLLTSNNTDLRGELISHGQKRTIKSSETWTVNRNTTPYPPARISKFECTLLLQHSHRSQ